MELVCNPKGHAPVRRPNSVRRTSTLDSTWPDGHGTNMHIEGRCRDLITRADIADHEVARYDDMSAELNPERLIKNVRSNRVDLSALVGARGHSRTRHIGHHRSADKPCNARKKMRSQPLLHGI